MINPIKDLYVTDDLPGEALLQPLKNYHRFFAAKIEKSSGAIKNLAWRVGHLATGLICYPLLGLIAAAGLLIKLTGIPGVYRHNTGMKTYVEVIKCGIKNAKNFHHEGVDVCEKNGFNLKLVQHYKITKENVDTVCDNLTKDINLLSNRFLKANLVSKGAAGEDKNGIQVGLYINCRA